MTIGGWICAAIVPVVVISIIAFSAGRSSIGAAAEIPWALLAATDWRQISACSRLALTRRPGALEIIDGEAIKQG